MCQDLLRYVIPSKAITPKTQPSSPWESHFEYLDKWYKSFYIQFSYFSFHSHLYVLGYRPYTFVLIFLTFHIFLTVPPPDEIEGYFLSLFSHFISCIFHQPQLACERLLKDIRRLSYYLLLWFSFAYLRLGQNKHPGNHFIFIFPLEMRNGFPSKNHNEGT